MLFNHLSIKNIEGFFGLFVFNKNVLLLKFTLEKHEELVSGVFLSV